MSNFLRSREVLQRVAFSAALLGLLGSAACSGDAGYGSSIDVCDDGDNTGVEATTNTHDENDPATVLKFAIETNTDTNGRNDLQDGSANQSFWTYGDSVDQLGEVACAVATGEENVRSDELVFTPSGLNAREAFIAAQAQAEER